MAAQQDEKFDPTQFAALFEELYAHPTLPGMHALSPTVFEHFIAHVFTCAGYTVQHVANRQFPDGPGVDLNLYDGPIKGKPAVRVEVRRYAPNHWLFYHDVADFVGVLQIAGGIPGYLVTTSSFNDNAHTAAAAVGDKVRLIDGQRLLRYITYIGGSRLSGKYAATLTAPVKPTSLAWLWKGDEVAVKTAHPPRTTRILAITNPKGGVAKTTTALNIGFALADLHKQRVLVVDMDGQASLSHSLPRPVPDGAPKGAAAPPDTLFLSDYFRGKTPLRSLIRATRFPNLSVVPGQEDLYLLQFAGADRARAELQFVEDVRAVTSLAEPGNAGQPYDWIILDTPATDTFYLRAALAAADYVIIPAFAETYALKGIEAVMKVAATLGALLGDVDTWKSRVLGCLVTRWKAGTNADTSLGTMRFSLDSEGIPIFRHQIPLVGHATNE
jgi:chromosome partitioning protein